MVGARLVLASAIKWLEVEFWTLLRLASMVEAEKRGEANATLLREMRYLEDAFGLSPASRRRLRWVIEGEDGEGTRVSTVNVYRLRP